MKNNLQFVNVERPKCKAPKGEPDAGNPLWVVEDRGPQKRIVFGAGRCRATQQLGMINIHKLQVIFYKWY